MTKIEAIKFLSKWGIPKNMIDEVCIAIEDGWNKVSDPTEFHIICQHYENNLASCEIFADKEFFASSLLKLFDNFRKKYGDEDAIKLILDMLNSLEGVNIRSYLEG